MAKFDNLSLYELMNSCLDGGYEGIKDSTLRDFIKEKSDNFDLFAFKLLISDIRDYVYTLPYCIGDEKPVGTLDSVLDEYVSDTYDCNYIVNINFNPDIKLLERIVELPSHKIFTPPFKSLDCLIQFSNLAEELYHFESKKLLSNSVSLPIINSIVPLKLISPLSTECLLAILDELIVNFNFILRTDTVKDDWLYWFGRKNDLPNPQKIYWYRRHSILPNVIIHICGSWTLEAIKNAFIAKKFISNKNGDHIGKPLYYAIERIKKKFE